MTKNKSLHNSENYNKLFDMDTYQMCLRKYGDLMEEYITNSIENIFIQRLDYYKYIIQRGISTLYYVFTLVLLYTKNVDVAYYHTQKAYYFFIEFMGQIGDDNHSFLQLNSTDATLFVYKKTIFEINNDIRKEHEMTEDEKTFCDNVNKTITVFNDIFNYVVSLQNFTIENKDEALKESLNDTLNIYNKLISRMSFSNHSMDMIKNISTFLNIIKFKKINYYKFFNIMDIIIKKHTKITVSNELLQKNLCRQEFDEILVNYTPLKVVNWLTS